MTLTASPSGAAYVERLKDLYRRRRDVMLEALEEHFGEQASWTRPQGGLFIWATLDEHIDTADLLALAQKREQVAFVPGRAAFMDGRRGSSSMRLNFAGVPDEDVREGGAPDRACHRRAARPVRRADVQAAATARVCESALADAGARRAGRTARRRRGAAAARGLLLGAAPQGSMSAARKVAVLKGGSSLERNVSLRSGAHAAEALARLGHEVISLDVGPALMEQLRASPPDAAFIALHGHEGEGGTVQALLEAIGIPYTGSGPAACMRCTDKALAKYLMREAKIPTPGFVALAQASIKELGAAEALADIEATLGFPLVVKPASQGSALGVKFARSAEELPGALVGAFSYDGKILIERYVKGRDLAVSVLDGDRRAGSSPLALPVVEAVPRQEDFYDYESRYEIGKTTFVCPAELGEETTARAQQLALDVYALLGCHGVARVDLMLAEDDGELWVLETNVVPGMTETSLLPQAADAAGIGFDELIARVLESASTRAVNSG